jgi:hypothetical protein
MKLFIALKLIRLLEYFRPAQRDRKQRREKNEI